MIAVPLDLDVKMKAVLIGTLLLIVKTPPLLSSKLNNYGYRT